MEVTLQKLRLSYFKGIKSLEMDFQPGENFIHGKNASGKTTVFDSVWFLFFGKDSTGRADFSIKTMDENNAFIEKVDHEVFGQFSINGQTKTFQRTYKQQWSKDNVLKGHTTDYEIDGFPVRLESEYRKQIEEFFKEELFKLLTSPLFFNSMKSADRRSVLINMASSFTEEQVFKSLGKKSKHMQLLEDTLIQGASLEQIKLKAARDKKNLREENDAIPSRIDEAERSKPEIYEADELQGIIDAKKGELVEIEAQIKELSSADTAHNKAVQDWQNNLFEAKSMLQKFEFQAEQEFNKWKNDQEKFPREVQAKIKELNEEAKRLSDSIRNDEKLIQDYKYQIQQTESLITSRTNEKAALANEWKEENAKSFSWNGSTCSACDRPLEGAQALDAEEQARTRFNKAKLEKIQEIERKGSNLKGLIDRNQQEIDSTNEMIRSKSKTINENKVALAEKEDALITMESSLNEYYSTPQEGRKASDFLSPDAKTIQSKIAKLETSKPEKGQEADTSELQANKIAVQNSLEELQKQLGNKEVIDRINKRIDELKKKEKDLAQAIADAEGLENACFDFGKAKVEMIEAEINAKFSLVSFKLFEVLLAGTEREICETIYKGVPFQDLNNAGKIQAGLDIINGLSKHYNTYLPIFIDNRESVTWLPEVQSQLINLVVDPTAEKLTQKNQESLLIEK